MYYLLKLLSLTILVCQLSHNTILTFEMLPKYVQPVTNPSSQRRDCIIFCTVNIQQITE